MAQKSAEREIKARLSCRNTARDGEGRAVINMTVKDDSGFISAYSECGTPVISGEVAEFIEGATHALRPNELLTLRIHSDCIDEVEKELYREARQE